MLHLPGCTKLFKFILQQDWDAAMFRAQNHPREARRWADVQFDNDRETSHLPLHEACALGPPVAIIDILLTAYPQAIRLHDPFFHRLPLHVACVKGASSAVVQRVLAEFPEAAHVPDRLGRTPLHYAVFTHAPLDVVRLLLETNPEAAEKPDLNGWLPLHVGIRHCASNEVLELLLGVYPAAVEAKTISGMTPMLVAEKFGVCTEPSKRELLLKKTPPSMFKCGADLLSGGANSHGAVSA